MFLALKAEPDRVNFILDASGLVRRTLVGGSGIAMAVTNSNDVADARNFADGWIPRNVPDANPLQFGSVFLRSMRAFDDHVLAAETKVIPRHIDDAVLPGGRGQRSVRSTYSRSIRRDPLLNDR